MTKQLIRSATSIIANIQEANAPESRKDFIHKLRIARKEHRETMQWLQLLKEIDHISTKDYLIITNQLIEIAKILNASIGTARKNSASFRNSKIFG